LKEIYSHVRIEISDLSSQIIDYIRDKFEFRVIARAAMTIKRMLIESISTPVFSSDYDIKPWKDDYLPTIAQLVADYSSPTLDAEIYPFFKTADGCRYLVKDMLGEKISKYTKILFHGEKPIGVCFIQVDNNVAQIPDFGITPEFQGKGLGKKLFAYSLKELIKEDENVTEVELAVTIENIVAYNLYKKLGFEEKSRINALIWSNESS